VRNDLGLLAEEYDPRTKRQLGNFPQAFSHVALVSCARILGDEDTGLALADSDSGARTGSERQRRTSA
jgi:hypothetical protein